MLLSFLTRVFVGLWLAVSLTTARKTAHKIALRRHLFQTRHRPGVHHDDVSTLDRRTITDDLLFSSSSILAPLQVGTPAQEINVLLDTSSADLAVFGADYSTQFRNSDSSQSIGPAFDSSASSTYKDLRATFQNNYGSGSSATYFVADDSTDTIAFRGMTLTEQPLGVIHRGNVSYGPAASGIMGLAFEGASLGLRATPPLQQLFFANALKSPMFSFALMRPSAESEQLDSSGVTQPGGIFTLGQLDNDQYEGAVGWSDLVSTTQGSTAPHKWLSKLDNITVNGNLVPDSQGIIANFDTGTSVSRGSKQLIDAILSQAQSVYKDDSGNYYVPCGENVAPAFNMTISMGGVSVTVEPLDMLFKTARFTADNGVSYCYSTLTPTDSDEYDIQIGDDALRSMFVAFSFNPPKVGMAAQSTNVHNQGAIPAYAFTKTRSLDLSTLSQPQASGFSKVSYTNVPGSATTHVAAIGSETIKAGGTYVPGTTPTMETVRASSTPAQIGTIATQDATNAATNGIERNPAAVTGVTVVDAKSAKSASAASMTVPCAAAWTSVMTVVSLSIFFTLSHL